MKKGFSLLVLSVFLIHFVGVYVYFVVTLQKIHHEKRALIRNLPIEKLQRLEFSWEEYHKAKVDEHEVKVEGKMYDIGRVEVRGEKVIVYALQDADEDNLLSFLNSVTKQTSKNDTRASSSFAQFASLLFLAPSPITIFGQTPTAIVSSTEYQQLIYFFSLSILAPPPKLMV